jgi:hypothetical protein
MVAGAITGGASYLNKIHQIPLPLIIVADAVFQVFVAICKFMLG